MSKRDGTIHLRITGPAKAALVTAAAEAGESLSDYVRRAAMARRKGHTVDVRRDILALRADINRLGSSANQIAREWYATGKAMDAAAVIHAYAAMKAAVLAALAEP